MTRRAAAAAAVLCLTLLAVPPAFAGKGHLRSGQSVKATPNGMVVKSTNTQVKGLRGALTFGLLGKKMKVTTEQSSSGYRQQVKVKREELKSSTQVRRGTSQTSSSFSKRPLLGFHQRDRVSRNDVVRSQTISERSANLRHNGSEKQVISRTSGMTGPTQATVEKLGRDGHVRSSHVTASALRNDFGPGGRMNPVREVVRTARGVELKETQSVKTGVIAKLTLGHFGKTNATYTTQQRAGGVHTEMRTPKELVTRDLQVNKNGSRQVATYAKNGREKERQVIDVRRNLVVERTEKLRRNGSVKEVVTRRTFASGAQRITTDHLRRDGTVRWSTEKASSPRDGSAGKMDWSRKVAFTARPADGGLNPGRTRFQAGISRVAPGTFGGGTSAFARTGGGLGFGSPTHSTWNATSSSVMTSSPTKSFGR